MPPKKRVAKEAQQLAMRNLPVTLLSGFLGSGKTSLLTHILTNKKQLRVAVILNEISSVNMDVVALGGSKLLQNDEQMVEMSNGCICCTLRMDLLKQLRELHASQQFDAVVIESSGIAEPMQVAETFFIATDDGRGVLQRCAPLDNCVTVVDASTLEGYMASSENAGETLEPAAKGSEDDKNIAKLLFDQLEFANVVLLNKIDMLAKKNSKASSTKDKDAEVERLVKLIRQINPNAKVIPCAHSQVDLKEILATGNFNQKFAEAINGWMEDIQEDGLSSNHKPETLEYGISSSTFIADRPFHPQRLHDWYVKYFVFQEAVPAEAAEQAEASKAKKAASSSEKKQAAEPQIESDWGNIAKDRAAARDAAYGVLFRSKGCAWVGNHSRSDLYASWHQAGPILTFSCGGYWDELQDSTPRTRLVFIGQDLKVEKLQADLKGLLLTDAEWKKQRTSRKDCFPDPFASFFVDE